MPGAPRCRLYRDALPICQRLLRLERSAFVRPSWMYAATCRIIPIGVSDSWPTCSKGLPSQTAAWMRPELFVSSVHCQRPRHVAPVGAAQGSIIAILQTRAERARHPVDEYRPDDRAPGLGELQLQLAGLLLRPLHGAVAHVPHSYRTDPLAGSLFGHARRQVPFTQDAELPGNPAPLCIRRPAQADHYCRAERGHAPPTPLR